MSTQGASQATVSSKTSRKSRRGKQQLSLVNRPVPSLPRWGFPNQLRIKHRYVETIILSSATGAFNSYVWKCNGMFDPNTTGTGHQPMYFDNLSAIYDHYTVVKSEGTFTFTPTQSTGAACQVCVHIDDDSSGPSDVQTCCEQSTAVFKLLPASANNPTTLKNTWSSYQFGKIALDNDNLQGTPSTDPVELSSFFVGIQALAAGTVQLSITADITYYAVWDELKTQAAN